ncbi:MAG: carbon dioxide concentrating mechanism protein CcmL, partial [Planctomycetales bacterium]
MRIAQVIGTVTLSRRHPLLEGASLRLAVPLNLNNLLEREPIGGDCIVVYDDRGAGIGQRIAISEGAEAAMPFRPNMKPIDVYNSAIL